MRRCISSSFFISALQEFYNEYGNGKPLDYIYGFFDALGVIRDLESANAPVQHFGHLS